MLMRHILCQILLLLAIASSTAWGQAASTTCLTPGSIFGGANGTPVTITQTIVVGSNVVMGDVHFEIVIDHDWVGDIHLTLTSPAGTAVVLQSSDGGNADDLDLTYADAGVAYGSMSFACGCFMQPAGDGGTALSDFAGENGLGVWTLQITDSYPSNADGVLQSLCLRLFTSPQVISNPIQAVTGTPTTDGSVLTWISGGVYCSVEVYLDGVVVALLPGAATTYTITGRPAGVPVSVGVQGVSLGSTTGIYTLTIIPLGALPIPKTEKVVLVIIDGLRYADGLGDPTHQNVPNMAALAAQGTLIEPFLNDVNTHTNRAIPAIVCGSWDPPISFYDPACNENNQYSSRPTVHEYFRQQLNRSASDDQYALGPYCPWRGSFNPSYGPSYWTQWVATPSGTDTDTWMMMQGFLSVDSPTLSTLYLSDVDGAGHSGNWNSYLNAIQNADQIVGNLWAFLQADPDYAGRTTMLVTNDHGRHTSNFQGHGDLCNGCQTIQLLAVGPGVRSGFVSTQQRSLIDITPTIGALLGFQTPHADGSVMTEILSTCQPDVGFAGPGNAALSICGGDLSLGTNATLRLVGGPPSGTVFALGTSTLQPASVAAGTAIDLTPDFLLSFPTSPAGVFILPGIPGGGGPLSVYLQMAFVDPAQVPIWPHVGFSNAVNVNFQ